MKSLSSQGTQSLSIQAKASTFQNWLIGESKKSAFNSRVQKSPGVIAIFKGGIIIRNDL